MGLKHHSKESEQEKNLSSKVKAGQDTPWILQYVYAFATRINVSEPIVGCPR